MVLALWLQPLVLGPAVLSGASGVELEVARRTRCASRRYLAVRRLSDDLADLAARNKFCGKTRLLASSKTLARVLLQQ